MWLEFLKRLTLLEKLWKAKIHPTTGLQEDGETNSSRRGINRNGEGGGTLPCSGTKSSRSQSNVNLKYKTFEMKIQFIKEKWHPRLYRALLYNNIQAIVWKNNLLDNGLSCLASVRRLFDSNNAIANLSWLEYVLGQNILGFTSS